MKPMNKLPITIFLAPALFALALSALALTGCATAQGTKSDYFGYRNALPAPVQDETTAPSQQTWQNPMQSTMTSSIAFVPVITPWYDSWSVFARPSLRFYGYNDFGWGGGGGFGWGRPMYSSFYDPFWSYGSSFMYYSSPWQSYNPYFGGYTPFGFYRSLGWWNNYANATNNCYGYYGNSSNSYNYGNINGNNGTTVSRDFYTPPQMRTGGTQRAFTGNSASMYNGAGNTSTAAPTYIGSYNGGGSGGGSTRNGSTTYGSSGNKASQYNTGYYSTSVPKSNGGNAATQYYGTPSYSGSTQGKASGWGGGYGNTSSSSGGNSSSGGVWNSGGAKSSGGYGGGNGNSAGNSAGSSHGTGSSSTGGSNGGGGGGRSRGGN
jgi:hypothetical protein